MRLRKGDLVYYEMEACRGKGLVSALRAFWLSKGCIEIIERVQSTRSVISRSDITKVISRENLKEWWKYL